MTHGIRTKRLAGTIRKHLSGELGRDVDDPRIAMLAIHEVSMTPDLSIATVKVRSLVGGESDEDRAETMAVLAQMAPRLRAGLARHLGIRRVPELRFLYDLGEDHKRHIEQLLAEIAEEDRSRSEE